jgi:transposase
MNISLEQKLQLQRRARQTKDKHEYTRLCVILARSEGMSPELIAQALRISVSSVYQYITDYEKENKTQHETQGGSISKLNEEQTKELIKHLETITYLYAKEICYYVREKYGIEYSVPGMTRWLKEHGFVYKEPVAVPGKLDPEKQEAFIKKYEDLKANLPEDEEIYFIDAVHPAHQSQTASGWIKKGETKTLPTTNKQKRVHFIGALALSKMEIVAKEYSTVNGENMIDFLKNLEISSSASRIHIICDNGRANKNKEVQEYLKTSKIEIHYLPPYSPNLNAIERLWKVMRELKTYNRCYGSFAEFTEAIRNFFFEDIPKIGDILKKRINDQFQRIKLNHVVFAAA